MRDKELRLALICYGGISLAVYMHGITREVWHLLRASERFHREGGTAGEDTSPYDELLADIATRGIRLRVLVDIIAGASAGGINGIFLGQAIATGQSLDPQTDLWLDNADVEQLLDPDARPLSRFSKWWAVPIALLALRKPGGSIETMVEPEARAEVRRKLSRFVRARWFAPPFGGKQFTRLLLGALDAMAARAAGGRLLPQGHPLDLFVTVTDFCGHPEWLKLNGPVLAEEHEHRLTIGFTDQGRPCTPTDKGWTSIPSLAFAARATASFPGAFPPFTPAELDGVLAEDRRAWPDRTGFMARLLPRRGRMEDAESLVLIDGSVLANAPFKPAMQALRDRPARREIDRRFVYIDPKPGIRSIGGRADHKLGVPGFFTTIFGALSDIPREQPIRDNLETLEIRSSRIRRMQHILDAIRPEVEAVIAATFGHTLFLDQPTPARLNAWRKKAQHEAARRTGFFYPSYGHLKLSQVVEEIARLVNAIGDVNDAADQDLNRRAIWAAIRLRGIDSLAAMTAEGASDATIAFFRDHDLAFRIRRLRMLNRKAAMLHATAAPGAERAAVQQLRDKIFAALADYLDRERSDFYAELFEIGRAHV
jgi:patatin-related protein